jgi:hypothetical protein
MAQSTRSPVPARKSGREISRLHTVFALMSGLARPVAASANGWIARFVASLDETRRQQADAQISRYRYLILDSDTGMHFSTRPTSDDPKE